MAGSELKRRVAVAAVGIPAGVVVIYLGGWVLGLVVAALAALGTRELFGLAQSRGRAPFTWLGVSAAVLIVGAAMWSPQFLTAIAWMWLIVLTLTLAALVSAIWLRGTEGNPLDAVAITVVGTIYVGGTLSFAVFIRELPLADGIARAGWEGAVLVLFPLAVTWASDSAAYFAGKRWGRRKLMPSVSPGKTVVGGVAALMGATLAAAIYGHLFLADLVTLRVGPVAVVGMGVAIGVAAQVGDLVESVLKRAAGVKDSGRLLPGHGGVLDRFDSLFLVLPLTYGLFYLVRSAG